MTIWCTDILQNIHTFISVYIIVHISHFGLNGVMQYVLKTKTEVETIQILYKVFALLLLYTIQKV